MGETYNSSCLHASVLAYVAGLSTQCSCRNGMLGLPKTSQKTKGQVSGLAYKKMLHAWRFFALFFNMCASLTYCRLFHTTDVFDDDQLFLNFVFANGGRDLEHVELRSFSEVGILASFSKPLLFFVLLTHECSCQDTASGVWYLEDFCVLLVLLWRFCKSYPNTRRLLPLHRQSALFSR